MVKQNVAPVDFSHTSVNFFRPPYGKEYPQFYKREGVSDGFQNTVDILFDTFFENYNDYRAGEMTDEAEESCRFFGIPGPSQYQAFYDLVSFSVKEEFEFLDRRDFYFYDLTKLESQPQNIPVLRFIENIINCDFIEQEKKIVLALGSFWENQPETRERMVELLEELHNNRGFKIVFAAKCSDDEEHVNRIKDIVVREKSSFGLKNRIAIHYIRWGDYVFLEFPHTEDSEMRLNMFLDLNTIELKDNLEKSDLVSFFDNLIVKATN